jgi:hypothetical protein
METATPPSSGASAPAATLPRAFLSLLSSSLNFAVVPSLARTCPLPLLARRHPALDLQRPSHHPLLPGCRQAPWTHLPRGAPEAGAVASAGSKRSTSGSVVLDVALSLNGDEKGDADWEQQSLAGQGYGAWVKLSFLTNL